MVVQNAKIIPADIFTNIVGASRLTLEDAWAAARMAGLDEDIKRMPMGMHTVIMEGGGTFSGRQRQRLMIARALVTRPRILLFDEATSALDNQTQAIVSRSLEALHATRIVIAHRLSTIMKADRIYVFRAGQIVQSGTYEALMRDETGLFFDLARRQLACPQTSAGNYLQRIQRDRDFHSTHVIAVPDGSPTRDLSQLGV